MKKKLEYKANFNNKLSCPVHTTIRLVKDLQSFQKDDIYDEYLAGKYLGSVTVIHSIILRLNDITNNHTYVDAGIDAKEFKTLLAEFYPDADLTKELFAFVYLKKI